MNIIETTAPIDISELKLFFSNKETFYMIHYEDSTLQGPKLLTYLGNLEIPCDIGFTTQEGFDEMTKHYLEANFIVDIPILKERVTQIFKPWTFLHIQTVHINSNEFLSSNKSADMLNEY